jgi:transposase
MLKYSIGLDISSQKINACICVIDRQQKVVIKSSTIIANTIAGFKNLDTWIQKNYKDKSIPLVICMEATGVYYENCALYFFKRDYSVSVILPNKAKKYIQSLGLKSKNDKADAKGLAQMGAEQSLSLWEPLGEYFYCLRTLTRQHQNLQEQKTIIKNQLHAVERAMYKSINIEKQLKKSISLLDKQLKETEVLISKHINSNQEVKRKLENICKIKGLGILTIAIIIAETNGFILFKNSSQLVSYAGYDIIENQSGNHNGKTKISKKGNSRIRRALFMPALCAVTHKQKPFINLFERTLKKHNIKMKSYVAVQKKLLTTIYALWKSNTAFTEDHIHEISKEKEQVFTSQVGFEKAEKNNHTIGVVTQGKHPREISQYVSSQVIQR